MKKLIDSFFKFLATYLVWKVTIYVVMGSTHVDETFSEWMVMAFQEEDKAKAYLEQCKENAKQLHEEIHKLGWYNCDREKLLKKNKLDPNMQMDFEGTTYSYRKIGMKV